MSVHLFFVECFVDCIPHFFFFLLDCDYLNLALIVFIIKSKKFVANNSFQDEHDAIDPSFTFRRFFFLAVNDSWPLSVLESLSESSSLELEDDELELLELSDAMPVLSAKFTWMAVFASSGSFT